MLLDVLLIVILLIGFITGFKRGILYSIFAFIAIFLGIMLAMKYSYMLTSYLYQWEILKSRFLPFISFVLILFIVIVIVKMCYNLIHSLVETLFLGTVNKIIGGLLWAIILVLVYSILLWYVDKLQLVSEEMKTASRSYQHIVSIAPVVIDKISRVIPYFHGMLDSIEQLFNEVTHNSGSEGIQV